MEATKLLILRLTDRCNLACKYCYAAYEGMQGQDMPLEVAQKAIGLFARPGGKLKIQFTGGEPLLCLELMQEIFRYVNGLGIQTAFSLQTNGTLLAPQACAALKKMRCAVGVSLDGIGAANGLRIYPDGTPSFDDAVAGIRMLGQAGIHCNLNAVVTRVNQGSLGELIDLGAMLGNVRGIGLDMFRPMGRGNSNGFMPDADALAGDLERLMNRHAQLKSLGADVRIKELEKVRAMLKADTQGSPQSCYCYAQTGLSAAVDPKGDIYPCASFVGMPNMRMGNVMEGFSLMPAVPGMDDACAQCTAAPFCRGGCPAGRAACGGRNEGDCAMHRTMIQWGRKEYA